MNRLFRFLLIWTACTSSLCHTALTAQTHATPGSGPTLKQALDFLVKNTAPSLTCVTNGRESRTLNTVSYEMHGDTDAVITLKTETRSPTISIVQTRSVLVSDLQWVRIRSGSTAGCNDRFGLDVSTRDLLDRVKLHNVIEFPDHPTRETTLYIKVFGFDAENQDLQQRLMKALERAIELAKPEPSAF